MLRQREVGEPWAQAHKAAFDAQFEPALQRVGLGVFQEEEHVVGEAAVGLGEEVFPRRCKREVETRAPGLAAARFVVHEAFCL